MEKSYLATSKITVRMSLVMSKSDTWRENKQNITCVSYAN